MKNWKARVISLVILLFILLILDIRVCHYSDIIYNGTTLVCIGRAEKVDASETGQLVTLKIIGGPFRGRLVTAENSFIGRPYSDRVLRNGDKLFLEIPLKRGQILPDEKIEQVYLREYFRNRFLLHLLGAFCALLIVVGNIKGLQAIGALAASGLAMVFIFVPLLLKGYNPFWTALFVSALATVATFLIVGGISKKVISGTLGTLGGVAACGILISISNIILHFTGLDVEFGQMQLGYKLWLLETEEGWQWNHSGILVAGIIIGALGAMMDVCMAISSAIVEVKKAKPNISVKDAIRSGLNVGKDIMGTMTNTLIFAYVGADMTLMVLPSLNFPEIGRVDPFFRLLNKEGPAVEAVQALVGTIGLVLAIPITALIAGLLTASEGERRKAEGGRQKVEGRRKEFRNPKSEIRNPKWTVPIALFIVVVLTHAAYIYNQRHNAVITSSVTDSAEINSSEYVKGRVLSLLDQYITEEGRTVTSILKVKLLGGRYKGKKVIMRNLIRPNGYPLRNVHLKPGDVFLAKVGGAGETISPVNVVDNYSRDGFIILLAGFLLLLIILIGRNKGVRTVIALIIAGCAIYFIMLPLLNIGQNALLVVTLTSGIIAAASLLIIAGFGRKTYAAILGTVGGVVIAAVIIVYAQNHLHLSGMEHYNAAQIIEAGAGQHLDFKMLLLAGMILGLLGAAMDGAIDVASAMQEIRQANPNLSRMQLIQSGMNVGTDLIGTMSNTLVFAYFGFRLLLVLSAAINTPWFPETKMQLLSVGVVTAEIVRILAGSIGLMITIPLTILISGFWHKPSGIRNSEFGVRN
ncbi:YibE/F family protein [Candidatus Poribacteria bacterium]|nr:YibE/F family protein [Candidatus Poribacteria bacterium]